MDPVVDALVVSAPCLPLATLPVPYRAQGGCSFPPHVTVTCDVTSVLGRHWPGQVDSDGACWAKRLVGGVGGSALQGPQMER